jgi:hypothetical protein
VQNVTRSPYFLMTAFITKAKHLSSLSTVRIAVIISCNVPMEATTSPSLLLLSSVSSVAFPVRYLRVGISGLVARAAVACGVMSQDSTLRLSSTWGTRRYAPHSSTVVCWLPCHAPATLGGDDHSHTRDSFGSVCTEFRFDRNVGI